MQIKFNPREQFAGRGPCIQLWGDWVTSRVWNQVAEIMRDNWIDSPVYHAKQAAGAFFQGGSNDPKGKFILLECWGRQMQDFLRILNEKLTQVIDPNRTQIRIVGHRTYDKLDAIGLCSLIAAETGCRIELSHDKFLAVFHPEDNVMNDKVLTLVMQLGLETAVWLDNWTENL